jgi:hypothetical protein
VPEAGLVPCELWFRANAEGVNQFQPRVGTTLGPTEEKEANAESVGYTDEAPQARQRFQRSNSFLYEAAQG